MTSTQPAISLQLPIQFKHFFPGLVHISELEKKAFLDLLGDDVTALDLAELAGLESIGDRPIDRLDRVASVCTEMHADVIGVERAGGAAARIVFDRPNDALAMLSSALIAHGLCVASSAFKTWDRAASWRRLDRAAHADHNRSTRVSRATGRGAGLEVLTPIDELTVVVSGQVGDRFEYINEGSFSILLNCSNKV